MKKNGFSLLIVLVVIVLVLGIGYVFVNKDKGLVGEKEEVALEEMVKEGGDESVSGYIDLAPEEANELIEATPDLVVIDVSPHYDEGHLPGAVSYYLGDGSLDEAIPVLDKSKTYLVYCHVDSVSIAGAEKLVEAGFTKVYRLEGNYSAWVKAGLPVETTPNYIE